MFEAMESAVPSVYTEGNEQGIQRVLAGNYAFLMESTTNEYHRERNCELTQIGTLLDAKNYALATPPGKVMDGRL